MERTSLDFREKIRVKQMQLKKEVEGADLGVARVCVCVCVCVFLRVCVSSTTVCGLNPLTPRLSASHVLAPAGASAPPLCACPCDELLTALLRMLRWTVPVRSLRVVNV